MNRFLPLRCLVTAFVLLARGLTAHAASEPPPPPRSLDELRTQLDAHLNAPRLKNALWGVKVVSLETGRTWFEDHADRMLSPASNCKLYTAALALDRLGSDYRIVTPIYGTAKPDAAGELHGDLVVSGRGDPSWVTRGTKKDFWTTFEPFIAAIEKSGVKHITGDLVADTTFIRGLPNGAGWTADDLMDDYGAEISAVSLEDNFADLRVTPGAKVGQPCELAFVQPATGLVLDNRTTTIATGGVKHIVRTRLFGENVVHVFGELPLGSTGETIDVTVPRPATWFATALKEGLARRGIRVGGTARSVRWPDAPATTATSVKLGEITSPPLHELITALMKESQNLETDLIFAYLGEKFRASNAPVLQTSEDSGAALLREFLKTNRLPAEEVRFEEGSGLSRNNLASANATVSLLKFMRTHRAAQDFFDALPIAGVDGTIRRRMKGTPAENNVHAKTGSLRFANSLSGYVTTAAGEKLAFSFMLNRNVSPQARGARDELDELAILLASFGVRPDTVAPAPAGSAAAPAAPRRPNILFAISDDQSWAHTSAAGCTFVSTPAFDRVAREGVRFTNSYCASPSCTASRSAVLTGRPIWQVGEGGVLYGTFPPFTHALADAGYFTGFTGKGWGPGEWQPGGLTRHPIGREYNKLMMAPKPHEAIDARDYAANFEAFLRDRPADAPFFFWFGATEPHRVYEQGAGLRAGKHLEDVRVPAYWPDTPEIRGDLLDYAGEIEWFDAHLARMLAKLEAMGELDNTLVVVTSDNGMPFPRAKTTLYDPGVRMPLAVRWPGHVPAGRVVDDFASHIDFALTFLEAAGVPVPKVVTGRSLLAVLTAAKSGQVDPARDCVYTALERHTWCRPDGATYPMRAVRTADFLYIHNFAPDRWPTGGPEFVSSNKTFHGDVDGAPIKDFMENPVNQRRFPQAFDLCYGKRPLEELYDVRRDLDQIHNLASDPAFQATREKLWQQLRSYLEKTSDPRIAGQDPWQGYAYRQTVGFGATFNRTLSEADRAAAAGRAAHKPQ